MSKNFSKRNFSRHKKQERRHKMTQNKLFIPFLAVGIASACLLVVILSQRTPNKNQKIQLNSLIFDFEIKKVEEYHHDRDWDYARRQLDKIVSKYDLSAPTDENIDYLITLSYAYMFNTIKDGARQEENLARKDDCLSDRKAIELARMAFRINRQYAKKFIETRQNLWSWFYNYKLMIHLYVDDTYY